ncbi:MAG: APC family permease [Ardenticatenales bacterium]
MPAPAAPPDNGPTHDYTVTIQEEIGGRFIRRSADYRPRRSWRTWLFGRPLATADAPHQTIGKAVGLAVFASDALSSTAYATQEILVVLAAAGTMAFGLAFPIALAIVALLTIVTISYEQTIHAYPSGGGAYIVSRDNLGEMPAQSAGAALLMDYILTVSVSISSGVAQLVSAFPALEAWRVEIAIVMVIFIMMINLRGVKESGTVFAVPTYFFLVAMFLMVGVGFFRQVTGVIGTVVDPPPIDHLGTAGLSLFLVLHAFSSGTTALTGVEAISNGITAFKEPKSRNAGATLLWMATILGVLFLGITLLSGRVAAVPSEAETVISQLARTVYSGRGLPYLVTIGATTVILIMAANTAFADFPRLAALVAGDGFLPRQLTYRGSRLVFSRGIATLALVACLLIVAFNASVTNLIPLYAIGVFLSFSLSQAGMAVRWRKSGRLAPGEEIKERGSVLRHDPRWRLKMVVNGFGALCTFVVMIVFSVTKFRDGAWIILVLVPSLIVVFLAIHHHYRVLALKLSLESFGAPPRMSRHRVIVPISSVHRGTLAALEYGRALSDDVTAVHVSLDQDDSDRLRRKWSKWGDGVRLVTLESPYRLLMEPLLEYIEEIAALRQPNELITVVVPQFVPNRWWHNLLHTQAALMLNLALRDVEGVVITDVPYQVRGADR